MSAKSSSYKRSPLADATRQSEPSSLYEIISHSVPYREKKQKPSLVMSMSSKAADIFLETGSSFKRIAELTMELVDPNSSNRLSGSSTSASQKIAIDSSELRRLRDALQRFSTDLDAVSQRVHANREAATAPQEVERLMSLTSMENNNEQSVTTEETLESTENQTAVPMTA